MRRVDRTFRRFGELNGGADALPGVVNDEFSDADDTLLTAHTPNVDQEGGGWVAYPTSWKISSGMAVPVPGADRRYMGIDSGEADVTIECDVLFPNPANSVGLVSRLQDGTHCWFYIIHATAVARIYKDNAGFSMVTQAAEFVAVPGTWYHFKVVALGNNHDFYIDDILRASVVGDAFLNTQTRVGFWVNGPNGSEFADSFVAYSS